MIRCPWEWYMERLPPSRKACFCTVEFFLMISCSRFPSDSCELEVAMKRFRRFRPFGTFQLRMDVSGSPSGPNKWLECFESWDILIRWVNPPLAHLARLQRSHFSSLEGWDVGEMGWMIWPCGFSVDFTFLSGFAGQTCSWGWYANHWITMHWSYWWIPAGAWTCKRCGRNLAASKKRAIWDMAPVLDSAHGPMDWTKPTLTGKQASLMQTSRSFAVCSSLWIRKLGIKAVQCGIAQKTVDNLVFYTRSAAVSHWKIFVPWTSGAKRDLIMWYIPFLKAV